MVKQYITKHIIKFLTQYIHDINEKPIEVGLLSGIIILENIKLKTEKIQKLFNFKLKNIEIGYIKLKFSYFKLFNNPIEIFLKNINVTLEKEYIFKKEDFLFEKLKFLEKETEKIIKKKESVNGFILKMFETASVKIEDINIFYEDDLDIFKFNIEKIVTSTVDENWHENIEFARADIFYKIFEINKFKLSFNESVIVEPCDFRCRIVVRKLNYTNDLPDVNVDFQISFFNAYFNFYIYKKILKNLKYYQKQENRRNNIKKNINFIDLYSRENNDISQIWQTVCDIQYEEPINEDKAIQLIEDTKRYKDLYCKFSLKKITDAESQEMNQLEEKLNINVLLKMRKQVLDEKQLEPKPRWFFFQKEVSEQTKKELYEDLEFKEEENNVKTTQFTFKINEFNLKFLDKNEDFVFTINSLFLKYNSLFNSFILDMNHINLAKNNNFIIKSSNNFLTLEFKDNQLKLKGKKINFQKVYIIKEMIKKFKVDSRSKNKGNKIDLEKKVQFNINFEEIIYKIKKNKFVLKNLKLKGNLKNGLIKANIEIINPLEVNKQISNNIELLFNYKYINDILEINIHIPEIYCDIKELLNIKDDILKEIKRLFTSSISLESPTKKENNTNAFPICFNLKLDKLSLNNNDFVLKTLGLNIKDNKLNLCIQFLQYNSIYIKDFCLLYDDKLNINNSNILLDLSSLDLVKIKDDINLIKSFLPNKNTSEKKELKFICQNTKLKIQDEDFISIFLIDQIEDLNFTGITADINTTLLDIKQISIKDSILIFDQISGYKNDSTVKTLDYVFSLLCKYGIFPLTDNPRTNEMKVLLNAIKLYDQNYTFYKYIFLESESVVIDILLTKIEVLFDCQLHASNSKDVNNFISDLYKKFSLDVIEIEKDELNKNLDNLQIHEMTGWPFFHQNLLLDRSENNNNQSLQEEFNNAIKQSQINILGDEYEAINNLIEVSVKLIKTPGTMEGHAKINGIIDSEFYRTVIHTFITVFDIIGIIVNSLFVKSYAQSFLILNVIADLELFNFINNEFLVKLIGELTLNGKLTNKFITENFNNDFSYKYGDNNIIMSSHENIYDKLNNSIETYIEMDFNVKEMKGYDENHQLALFLKHFNMYFIKHDYGFVILPEIEFLFIHLPISKILFLKHVFLTPNVNFGVPGLSNELFLKLNIDKIKYKNIELSNLNLCNNEINLILDTYEMLDEYTAKYFQYVNVDVKELFYSKTKNNKIRYDAPLNIKFENDHEKSQLLISLNNIYILNGQEYNEYKDIALLSMKENEHFKKYSFFYEQKNTFVTVNTKDLYIEVFDKYIIHVEFFSLYTTLNDGILNYSGNFNLNVKTHKHLVLEPCNYVFNFSNNKLELQGTEKLRGILSKEILNELTYAEVSIKNFTDLKYNIFFDNKQICENKFNIQITEQEFIEIHLENSEKLFIPFKNDSINFTVNNQIYLLDVFIKNSKLTLRFFYNILFKNYTEYKINLLIGNENVNTNDFDDKITILPFEDASIKGKYQRLHLKLLIENWKEYPDNLFFYDSEITDSDALVERFRTATFLFHYKDEIRIICADVIVVFKENVKTFYVLFYSNYYLYNGTDKKFQFILQNVDYKFEQEIEVGYLKNENLNHQNHENLKNASEFSNNNNTDLEVKSASNKQDSGDKHSVGSFLNDNLSHNTSTIRYLEKENTDTFDSFNNIITLPYSGSRDTVKLFYENEHTTISSLELGKDKTIKLSDNLNYGVIYDQKERFLHSMKYISNIFEIIIYPFYIINNNLDENLYIGKTSIKKGRNMISLDDKKSKIYIGDNFRSKNEVNFLALELFEIIKMRNKEFDRLDDELYTFNAIFGKAKKVSIKKSDKLEIPFSFYYHVPNNDYAKNISLEMKFGSGKYRKSRIVNISNANYIKNNTNFDFMITVAGRVIFLKSEESSFIHFDKIEGFYIYFNDEFGFSSVNSNDYKNYDCYKINNQFYKVENKRKYLETIGKFIPIVGISFIYFILTRKNNILFKLKITIKGKRRFIHIEQSDKWPLVLINNTKFILKINQLNTEKTYYLKPTMQLNYCFDDLMEEKTIVFDTGKSRIKFSYEEGSKERQELKCYAYQISDNKFIEITDKDASNVSVLTIFQFSFLLPYLSLTIANQRELFCLHTKNILLNVTKEMINEEEKTIYEFGVGSMQIDDQNIFSSFPIIMYPKNKIMNMLCTKENIRRSFLKIYLETINHVEYDKTKYESKVEEITDNITNDQEHKNTCKDEFEPEYYSFKINYFSFLMQSFYLQLNEKSISDFINIFAPDSKRKFILQCEDCLCIKCKCLNPDEKVQKQVKIDAIRIHPIVLNLSFKKDAENKKFFSKIVKHIVENISDLKINLNAFILDDIDCPLQSIQEIIYNDYKSQALKYSFKVLASVNILGNVGSFTDTFSVGVKDLFYEPVVAMKEEGKLAIPIGIAKGGYSLIKHSVSGISGMISSFSKGISKNLSLATFDKEFMEYNKNYSGDYVNEKQLMVGPNLVNVSRNIKPMAQGCERFVDSIASGVGGIISKPIEGAKKGFGGFIKGIGKGAVGAVTKPVIGMIDFAGGVADSISVSLEENRICRLQMPRFDLKNYYDVGLNMSFYAYEKYLKTDDIFIYGITIENVGHVILTNNMVIFTLKLDVLYFKYSAIKVVSDDSFMIGKEVIKTDPIFIEKLRELNK